MLNEFADQRERERKRDRERENEVRVSKIIIDLFALFSQLPSLLTHTKFS